MKRLEFTVTGRPVSLNATYERRALRGGGPGLRRSSAAEDYYRRVQAAAVGALGSVRCPFRERVVLEVVPWFTREADAGAVSKLVQDALEGLAYEDDRAVLLALAWKGGVDAARPRTEVVVWCLEPGAREVRLSLPLDSVAEAPGPLETANRNRLRSSVRRYGLDR